MRRDPPPPPRAPDGDLPEAPLAAARRESAEQYITDLARTRGEISFLLGFSGQSTCSRAVHC